MMVGLYVSVIIVQPVWVIEEYPRILRSCVWLRPPQLPTIMDRVERVRRMCVLIDMWIWYMIEMGASFCHVRRSRPEVKGVPWVTSGTQKWKGVIPSFMAIAIVIIRDGSWLA